MIHVQDSPYIKTIHYDNADSFIEAISYQGELYNLFDKHFIFRGHSTDKYELLPSALRGYLAVENGNLDKTKSKEYKNKYIYLASTELVQIQEEYKLLQDFFQTCDNNGLYVPHIESLRNSFLPGVDAELLILGKKWIPKEYWELAALAQHHGVKTRLLDWTRDIHIALYFATTGVYNDPKERLDFNQFFKAYRNGEDYPPKHDMEIWALYTNVLMAEPAIMPFKVVQPRYHNNSNLCAQKGMFTFWETIYPGMPQENAKLDTTQTDRRTLDVQLDSYLREIKAEEKPYLYQITIPKDAAYSIYSFIEKMGYNASIIFPGYDGVARFLKEHEDMKQIKRSWERSREVSVITRSDV